MLVFSVDVFSGPQMTSNGRSSAWTPTRDAANLLIAAGSGQGSPGRRLGRRRLAVALVALVRRAGGVLVRGPDEELSDARAQLAQRPRWRSATSSAGRWC